MADSVPTRYSATDTSHTALLPLQTNEELRRAFLTGKTQSIEYRQNQLKQLAFLLQDNQDAIADALAKDLGRSKFETIFAELMLTITETVHAAKKVKSWAKKEYVNPGLAWGFHRPHIRKAPKGTVLVLGAWNYPIVSLTINHCLGSAAVFLTPRFTPCRTFKSDLSSVPLLRATPSFSSPQRSRHTLQSCSQNFGPSILIQSATGL